MKECRYITAIKEYLLSKYGKVNEEWELSIQLLADNIKLYEECKQIVSEVGIYNYEKNKRNPLLATMKETQGVILKQIQHLGISPYAASKIRSMSEDDNINDFIDTLTN